MARPAKVDRICQRCGASFLANPYRVKIGRARFCSYTCRSRSRTGENAPRWAGGRMVEIACQLCGVTFKKRRDHVASGRARFCSHHCRIIATLAKMPHRDTKPERQMAVLLDLLGIRYEMQKPFPGIGVVDFFIPEQSLVIEVDGTYWHGRPEQQVKDEKKDAALSAKGVRVVRVPESELRGGAK